MAETEARAEPRFAGADLPAPDVSIVVTLYNEASSLEELYRRTVEALDSGPRTFELIFVDDGSTDGTFAALERLHHQDGRVRAVRFKRNFGQHPAMHGSIGKQKFTKALVLSGGASVIEVDVAHAPRHGPSRYSPLRLTRMALHVLAGFWPQPIQWIGVALGTVCSLLALGLGAYGVAYWIDKANFPGPLFGGVAVLFVLGIQGFILALIGEYLGRIQRDVEGRPLYTIDREI